MLIIGGRYGFIDKKSAKSVTNLEYLTARAKGIPIYAFVDKGILPLLPVWEKNQKAEFNDVVSDTKVFEFIRQVRSVDSVWTYEFEHAQSIVQTLRLQFAHLMKEGLQTKRQISLNQESIPANLSGKALRILLEKPQYWEYYLFAQTLVDEVNKYFDLREEHRLNLMFSIGDKVSRDDGLEWIQDQLDKISQLLSTAVSLVNEHLVTALGPPGTPGNPQLLIWTAKKVAEVYYHALKWSQHVRQVNAPSPLRPVFEQLVKFPNDLIEKIEEFGPTIIRELDTVKLIL